MSVQELLDRSATDICAALASRRVTVSDVAEATLARIEARNGPLNAIVARRPAHEIMAEARDMDARGPDGGALWGLPMAIKDLAEVRGLRCTYGSPLFADFVPVADCPMVARLRAAGALFIGKTNTPEWGLGSHSFNPVHGVTRNPWNTSRSAGGSSGGAAAALAARMVALADGSDMMGSLRNPAGWNGIYGLRPSYGLVPPATQGDLFLHPLSTDGPMARTPDDLALLLSVMARPDPAHPSSCGPFQGSAPAPKRIGWIGDWGGHYPMEPGVLETCEAALDLLRGLGCDVIPYRPRIDPAKLWRAWVTLRSWAVADRLGALYDDPKKRARLKPAAIWEVEQGRAVTADAVRRASAIRSDWFRETARQKGMALALPSAQMWPFDADSDWPRAIVGHPMDTYHRWMEVVVPASLTGLPAISVPAGFGSEGLPMGLQLVGHRGQDAGLLALASAYHADAPWVDAAPQ